MSVAYSCKRFIHCHDPAQDLGHFIGLWHISDCAMSTTDVDTIVGSYLLSGQAIQIQWIFKIGQALNELEVCGSLCVSIYLNACWHDVWQHLRVYARLIDSRLQAMNGRNIDFVAFLLETLVGDNKLLGPETRGMNLSIK